MGGQQNHRQSDAADQQFFLKLDTAHSQHPQIGHQATGAIRIDHFEEFFGGGKRFGVHTDRTHQRFQRLPRPLIVVNDIDRN